MTAVSILGLSLATATPAAAGGVTPYRAPAGSYGDNLGTGRVNI